ncbi:MAG TPA: NAD(P)/FAD-dependent oxidoreductase, partial [Terriglobales bacterium]|nr:NAD(P)/FAD-dependent oxidoreductase [Terriglobales bacterium]
RKKMKGAASAMETPRVVIIGAGFGGLQAAKRLAKLPVNLTLIDRNNHHTFQPLLYQVASTLLSPAQIATPLRTIFRENKNVDVVLAEVTSIDVNARQVRAAGVEFTYDYLIVAAGARHSYFGHDGWEENAPGLKTIDDALQLRQRILLAIENSELEAVARKQRAAGAPDSEAAPLNFVVIGGGPTGVEVAGMLASLTHIVMREDFRGIDPRRIRVVLLEAGNRVLSAFSEGLSRSAQEQLSRLGVEVRTSCRATEVGPGFVQLDGAILPSAVTIWATGVAASPLARFLSKDLDRVGRVPVAADLTLAGQRNVFVIGDLAAAKSSDGATFPGLASVAHQQGAAVATYIENDLKGIPRAAFVYRDRGLMATIGRRAAVAEWRKLHISGTIAWLLWAFVHAMLLLDLRSRTSVLREWAWSLLTRRTSAPLITGLRSS